MSQELRVIADFYDFMLWTIKHTEKFPRHHRYSLGISIEQRLQHVLALLLKAKYTREKAGCLAEANLELEVLRFQLRLAADLEALSLNSQGFAAQKLVEIGAQVGGWLKSAGRPA